MACSLKPWVVDSRFCSPATIPMIISPHVLLTLVVSVIYVPFAYCWQLSLLTQPNRGLAKCLRTAEVVYNLPSDERYEQHRRQWQSRRDLQFKPSAITFPTTQEQVSGIIACAAKLGYKVSARSGGHSAVAGSLGGRDGGIVIDLAAFDKIDLDEETGIAIMGAGSRLGPAYLKLLERNRIFSGGACPQIGIGGMLSHGGYSLYHRRYGLGVDNVMAYDLVFANGTMRHVDQKGYPELFWGMRGFAPNFAVVTRFHVQTYESGTPFNGFSMTWMIDAHQIARCVKAVQNWAMSPLNIPEYGALVQMITNANVSHGLLNYTLANIAQIPQAMYERNIKTLFDELPKPHVEASFHDMSLVELMKGFGFPLDLDLKDYHDRSAHYYKSAMLSDDIPEDALIATLEYQANADRFLNGGMGQPQNSFMIELLGGYESRVNQISPDSSSFSWRNVRYNVWIEIRDDHKDYLAPEAFEYAKQVHSRLVDNLPAGMDYGCYINYADLDVNDPLWRYFGNNYGRLQRLKRAVDPLSLFTSSLGVKIDESAHN